MNEDQYTDFILGVGARREAVHCEAVGTVQRPRPEPECADDTTERWDVG